MAIMKFLLPALAVVAGVAAQNSACNGPTTTLVSPGDASALASCTTYKGDVVIATQAAAQMSIDGIQEITGDLTVNGAVNLTGLEGDSLTTIGGKFLLNGLVVLSSLNFPVLTNIETIQWVALPNLQELSFTDNVQMAQNVLIENTQLNSLNGINLQEVAIFEVNNNPFLKEISMQFGNISQQLSIEANDQDLAIQFPNLEWAFNMTFRNATSVSMPSLASVNGSLGFYENYFTEIALPNLTTIGGSMAFDDNAKLKNISLPQLTKVDGAYDINNNTVLDVIDGFKKLQTVTGAVDFTGNFNNISLPALSDVHGAFNVQSTGQLNCDTFNSLSSSKVIKGKYTCKGMVSHPSTINPGSGGSSSGGSSGSGSGSGKKSAGVSLKANAGVALGFVALVAGALHLAL